MRRAARKIAFISPHCVMDFTNGAATATLDALSALSRAGFECQAFCNTHIDAMEEVLIEEILARRGVRYHVRNAQIGQFKGRMIFAAHGPVPVTLFNSASTRGGWINREEVAAFLTACEIFLARNRPDVVLSYGGDAVALAVQGVVKHFGIPIAFALHNFSYHEPEPFRLADRVIVPTEYARRHYQAKLGLECDVLPLVIDPGRVKVAGQTESPHPSPLPKGEGTFVTFVNPEPRKGVFVFARIAEAMAQRRPDIPLLLVEGAAKASSLLKMGIDFSGLKNLRIMPNTPDARQFLAATRLLLMPSLMENAGLVAMEAMFNGIPVLASTRGGLPETMGRSHHAPRDDGIHHAERGEYVGTGGFLFDIPARYTPETRDLPTAEEVEPWVETIIRLWDDQMEYDRISRAARERAQQWHPDHLATIYRDFFSHVMHQLGVA